MREKVLISTGGSGGHVIPAIIIHDHLKEKYDTIISTDSRGLKYLEKNDYRSILIDTPKFNSLILFPFTLFKVLILTINSLKILKKEKISYLIFLPLQTQHLLIKQVQHYLECNVFYKILIHQ